MEEDIRILYWQACFGVWRAARKGSFAQTVSATARAALTLESDPGDMTFGRLFQLDSVFQTLRAILQPGSTSLWQVSSGKCPLGVS
jgi:hypothetical protein